MGQMVSGHQHSGWGAGKVLYNHVLLCCFFTLLVHPRQSFLPTLRAIPSLVTLPWPLSGLHTSLPRRNSPAWSSEALATGPRVCTTCPGCVHVCAHVCVRESKHVSGYTHVHGRTCAHMNQPRCGVHSHWNICVYLGVRWVCAYTGRYVHMWYLCVGVIYPNS